MGRLTTKIVPGDWTGVAHAISRLDAKLNTGASPTFLSIGLTGLTASRLLSTDSNKVLTSADLYAWVTGTPNQVLIADDGDGTITLSTPQDIHTGASPTFAGLTVTGISRLDGGAGVGIDPTTMIPFYAQASENGSYSTILHNTDSGGESALGAVEARGSSARILMIGYGSGFAGVNRWGRARTNTVDLISVGDVGMGIGTLGNTDLVLGANSALAMTIAGATRDITVLQKLVVSGTSLTVRGLLQVDNNSFLGDDASKSTTINNAYILPQDIGTTDFLVKQTGTGTKWGYVDEGTLDVATADAVAVVDAGDTGATFYLGLWDSVSGDLEGKTDVALTFNALTNALTLGGQVIIGTTGVFGSKLIVDSGQDAMALFSDSAAIVDISMATNTTSASIFRVTLSKVGDNLALQRNAGDILIGTVSTDGKLTIVGDDATSAADNLKVISIIGGTGFAGIVPLPDGGNSGGMTFETLDGGNAFGGGTGGDGGNVTWVLGDGGTGAVAGTAGCFSVTTPGDIQLIANLTRIGDLTNETLFASDGSITQAGTAVATLVLTISSTQTKWDAAYDNMVTAIAFNTGDGIITITQQDSGTLTTDSLDGRYYTETELGSVSNGVGASLIGVEDAMSIFTATNVEAALEEIMDRITPVTYSANAIATTQGTPTGDVTDIQTINDGNEYLVDEATGAPGFITTVTFTGISGGHEANKVQAHYSYSGNHTITLQIEKAPFDGSAWDNITTITNTGGVLTFLDVEIGGTITDYFNSGTTKIRWNHIGAGNINHDFILDYNVIKDDSGSVSGISDHGALSGRGDDDHIQYHTDARAATWLAANHETTFIHADIATNTTHRGNSSQAHSDYLINNGADETSGVLTAAGFTVGDTAITDGVITDATGLNIVADTSITGDFTVDTNVFHVDSTLNRVGIGTITPQEVLHVSVSTDARIEIENTGADAAVFKMTNTEGSFGMVSDAGRWRIYDYIAEAYRLIVEANGDVNVVNNFTAGTIQADNGFTGSWVNAEGDTVTVVGGIITGVAP